MRKRKRRSPRYCRAWVQAFNRKDMRNLERALELLENLPADLANAVNQLASVAVRLESRARKGVKHNGGV